MGSAGGSLSGWDGSSGAGALLWGSFQMEPERYGEEEATPWDIPQLPFEEGGSGAPHPARQRQRARAAQRTFCFIPYSLLDEYMVFVTDFYEDLNKTSQVTCYQEFGSTDIEDIRELRTIIGKRFYHGGSLLSVSSVSFIS